jgi:Protein of unknown function (DUF1588)/Protein of unknown function (DUF1585)
MCQKVPDPPPNVDFSAFETADSSIRTARERLTLHRKSPVCAGCHKITDPIGLALENFDGAAQYRTAERGAQIDPSGNVNGIEFNSAKGLGSAIKNDPAVRSCLVRRLYEYAVGRPLEPDEKPVLAYLEDQFSQENGRFFFLLRTLAMSDAFYGVTDEGKLSEQRITGSGKT